ncbi:MAG TPA: hypothetical protein VI229_00725 [Burkholderiales bacterium]
MTAHGHLRAAIVLAAVCLAAPAALGQQAGWVAFGSGAEVRLPPYLWSKLRDDKTLAVASKGGAAIQFSLEFKAAIGGSSRSGEAAVQALAKQLDLKVFESGDKQVLMEPRSIGTIDAREARRMRMHIGFGRSLVVMDLMVYENQKDAPEVLQFFETDMEQIILSIRRARG